jgi:DNA transposition AAA+ family ATPase
MQHVVVPTASVTALTDAFGVLNAMAFGVPRIALVYGQAGYGKTTGVSWLSIRQNGVFLTASPVWTPNSMLSSIAREVGREVGRDNQKLMDEIVQALNITRRPLFLDDIDHIFECNQPRKLFETLRYLHDSANIPLFLVGMDRIGHKISRWEQLSSRVAQEVRFQPLNLEDAEKIAVKCCEVSLAGDLVAELHNKSGGSCRRMIVGLARIEAYAKGQGLKEISLPQWKAANRPLFLEKK